jgi:hypothetical protein
VSGPGLASFEGLTFSAGLTWQYEMLQKYGSPVRIATNELIFSDMKAWSDIYGQSSNPCQKEKVFYNMFTVTG